MNLIVVEGIGDIVSKPGGYGPSLQKLKIDIPNLKVVFCDNSERWSGKKIRSDRLRTIEWLQQWGGKFIDKAKDIVEYAALLSAEVDAVIIAVPDSMHISLAKYWLQGNCKRVFIEKPLTDNLEEAQNWLTNDLYHSEEDYARVIALDHYRPRVHDRLVHKDSLWLLLTVIGDITKFTFYFLEDHSSTDIRYLQELGVRGIDTEDRNGPIENEGRVDSLKSGLILDLMSHVLAILEYFGSPESIRYEELQPAIYTGVDYDYSIPATTKTETFAAVKFTFDADTEKRAQGFAYIGKGIRGSRKYEEMGGNVKVLEIEGDEGKKIEINFRTHEINIIENGKKTFFQYLERDPYYFLLRDIAFKREAGGTVGLSLEMATIILERLVQVKTAINYNELQTYRLGDKGVNRPPLLEELLTEITPVRF